MGYHNQASNKLNLWQKLKQLASACYSALFNRNQVKTPANYTKQQIGQQLELFARKHLQKQGLKLRKANYSCQHGEIDLIMQLKDALVFVEVRYRSSRANTNGVASVNSRKQEKIIRTANHFMQEKGLIGKFFMRFDIVGIDENQQINWVKEAFSE